MSSSAEESGVERFVGVFQPASGGEVALVYVLNEAEDQMVATGEIEASSDVTSVAPWDAALGSLGFVRTSSWSLLRGAVCCTVERIRRPD